MLSYSQSCLFDKLSVEFVFSDATCGISYCLFLVHQGTLERLEKTLVSKILYSFLFVPTFELYLCKCA